MDRKHAKRFYLKNVIDFWCWERFSFNAMTMTMESTVLNLYAEYSTLNKDRFDPEPKINAWLKSSKSCAFFEGQLMNLKEKFKNKRKSQKA